MLGGGTETMSNKIDQRIVEMSFENHKFEKGINQSKNSLKEFANALQNMGSDKDFSGLDNSIQSVSSSFSMLEQIGIGALRRIGEAAMNAGSQLLKSLTIDPLSMGWGKYEQKTASVQTIMNATGKSIDEVNGYLNKLMWFSDETSYGFTDMTAALAQMTSSGGNIDTLIPMITGVANATAYAGKGAVEFSRAMYNLNQSYGRGNLEYMDWKSLELAGVAGKDLKQVFIDTGKALGVLDEKGRTAKGTLVTIGTFASTLSEKWADTRVMEAAFGKFSELSEEAYKLVNDGTFDTAAEAIEFLSGKYSLIAEKGFKSAQQAKSFSEAINATLDAVSSGWMRTYEIIFGGLHEATANFTALTEMLWTVFASGAEGRNEMLQAIKDAGGVKTMFQSIKNVAIALLKPLKAISEAFDQFFPPHTMDQWMGLINTLEFITRKLIITDETAKKIQRTFAGFFAVVDLGWQTIKFLGSSLYEILGIFIPLNGNLLEMSASVGDFLVMLNQLIKRSGVFEYGLLGIKVAAALVQNMLSSLSNKFTEFIHTLWTTDKPLEFIGSTIKNIFSDVINILKTGISWISGKFIGALKSVQKFLSSTFNTGDGNSISGILSVLRDFIDFIVKEATNGLFDFGDALRNLDFSRIATFVTGGVLLLFVNQLSNLTNSMATLLTTTNSFVTKFSKKLFGTQTKIKDLAYTFGILTASLYVLSRIPWEDLKKGLKGLAAAMLIFVGAYAALQAITVAGTKMLNGAKAVEFSFNLMTMAGGLAIMAIAIQKISKIDGDTIWKSVSVVGAMMGLIVAYQALSVAISLIPGTRTASVGISVMASGLLSLVGLAVLLNYIDPTTISKGLGKLAGAMVMLAGIQALFALASRLSGGGKMSLNLLGVAGGIIALIGVIKLLSLVSPREMSQGIGNVLLMGGVIAAIQLMFNIAGRVGGGLKFKTNIFSMQMGIISMIALVAILGTMNNSKIQNGIKNIAKMAGIIAGLEVLTALAARLGKGHKLQKILGSVTLTMLSFVTLIGLLSWYKEETINKGLVTILKMSGIIIAIELLTALIGRLGGTTKGVSTLIGIVSTLLTLTASLALLSMIDQEALREATISLSIAAVAIGAMATGLSIMIKALSGISMGFMGLKTIVQNLIPGFIAMGAIILATLAFLGIIKMALPMIESISWDSLGKFTLGLGLITSLVAGFTLLTKVPGLVSGGAGLLGLIPGFVGVTTLVLATAGLFTVIKSVMPIVDSISWNGLEKFVSGLAIVGVLAVGLALLGPVFMTLGAGFVPAIGGALVAIVGAGLVIGAFVGLSTLLEKLFGNDPDFLIRGMDKLVLVGEGMGRFIGSIVGGFKKEVIVGYGEGLAGFASALNTIDPASFNGVESLAKAILTLTGASLLDGLSRFVNSGKNPGEVFGEQIQGLLKAFKGITVEDATNASAVIAALAPMTQNLTNLAEATNSIPNSGGLLGGLLGNNDVDDFGKQIEAFIKSFKNVVITEAYHVASVFVALTPMVDNLKAFANAADKIPNSGGLLGGIIGNNDVDDFGAKLTQFVNLFAGLGIATVNTASQTLQAMTPMVNALAGFSAMADTIPNSGGMFTLFTGDNEIKDFAKQIKSLINSLGGLDASKVAAANTNISSMTTSLLPGLGRFITLYNNLEPTGGTKQTFTGEASFIKLAEEIKTFVNILKGVDMSVVSPALNSLAQINESFKIVGKEVIDSALASFENNRKPFQTAIIEFLDDIIKQVDNKREGITKAFTTILDIALSRSREYIKDFRQLGSDIAKGLQNGVNIEKNSTVHAMEKMTGAVINSAKNTLQTRSPSKVFTDIGGWLGIGLANGIKRNSNVAVLASANMATGVEDAVRNTLEVHSESPKFNGIGEWISKSLGSGIESAKGAVLNTAQDLGFDVTNMTVKGVTEGLAGGEGAVTTGIKSLLEILTGEKTISEIAGSLGIETGSSFSDGYVAGVDTKAVKGVYSGMAKDAFQAFKESVDKRREYNLINAWQEIELWMEFAKKYAEGTEIRMKADREVARLRFEYSKTWIDKEKYYKRLSLDEELAAWERVQARYKEGHEYRLQAEREIFRVKQEIWQAEYQHALDYIDDEKYYGRMNLSEELDAMRQVANMTEENSDERKKADREIFRLENEIRDTNLEYEEKLKTLEEERTERRKKAEEDYYNKTKEINDKLERDIKSLNDAYENAVESRAKTLYSTYGLFDKVDKPEYVSGFELINNLEDQNTAFDKWQNSIGALAAKGVDEGLIKELRDMGPKSLAQINALNRLSDSELARYVDLWQKKSKEAKDQAIFELQGMKEETQQKIIELTANAKSELRHYKQVWKDALREIDRDTEKQLDQIQEEWTTSIGSMTESGISMIQQFRLDWFGEIANIVTETKSQMAELKSITSNLEPMANAVSTAVTTTLSTAVNQNKVSSIAETTGSNYVTGLATGITKTAPALLRAANDVNTRVNSDTNSFWMTRSPSRRTMETGKFIVMGLAEGMKKTSSLVSTESKNVGKIAFAALSSSMSSISDLLGNDVDAFTIKPVLDLSNVRSGMNDVSSILGGASGLDLTNTMRLLPKAGPANQNGILADIRNGLLSMTNPELDLNGKLTVEVVNDKGEIIGIAETAIRDLLRRESR